MRDVFVKFVDSKKGKTNGNEKGDNDDDYSKV